MVIYKMPFLGVMESIIEALASTRFTKSQLLNAFNFYFFACILNFNIKVKLLPGRSVPAVLCCTHPHLSVCLVLPWCTQVQECGELFANVFLAGLPSDSSVNVLSAPEALPVKLEPAQMPFDAELCLKGCCSKGVFGFQRLPLVG